MAGRALVLFGTELPKRGFSGYDTVIAPRSLESSVRAFGPAFEALEDFVDPGSVQEAAKLVQKLSLLTAPDGRRIAKLVNHKGYELWWMHYDDLYYKFCLPFTQYGRLLHYLKDFDFIYLHKPPASGLFAYFLDAHQSTYKIFDDSRAFSFGLVLQALMSLPFLVWLMVRRPKLMVWTSDQFDGPRDHDFRMRFIYDELRRKKIRFVEFIRSMEPTPTVLRHALHRKRAVIYSFAICNLFAAGRPADVGELPAEPQEAFLFLVATHYLRHGKGDLRAIRAMKLIMRCIGTRVAIIDAAVGRNFPEVLACKLLGIPTIGILHGVPSKDYPVYDFMPEFDGEKTLSVDKYGVWSQWWKEYYLKNGKAYRSEQLYVSGPMRPVQYAAGPVAPAGHPLKVLFLSEQLAAPAEILPYLSALMEAGDVSLYFKFRSYRDGFEEWLKTNRPDLLKKMDPSKIMRGAISDAIAVCDVIVGSHTGGVLEALLQLKLPLFFYTKKWGDYFGLESFNLGHSFIAHTPQELLELIRKSGEVPRATLEELQHRFFGDPHRNGSAWVVGEAEKLL